MFECARSPLALVVAEVLVDGGFQLKEVLFHCSSDGSLNYPGKTHKNTTTLILQKHPVHIYHFYCLLCVNMCYVLTRRFW